MKECYVYELRDHLGTRATVEAETLNEAITKFGGVKFWMGFHMCGVVVSTNSGAYFGVVWYPKNGGAR